jgi:hypothetical protein
MNYLTRTLKQPIASYYRCYATQGATATKEFVPPLKVEHELGSTENYGADQSLQKKSEKDNNVRNTLDNDRKFDKSSSS